MRRFRFRFATGIRCFSVGVALLCGTRVTMAHSLQPPTPLQGSLELLAVSLVALLIVRLPKQVIRRIVAMRRERALFRSMASHSRQASIVCEPMHGPGGTIFDFRILYTNKRGSQLFGPPGPHARTLVESIRHSESTAALQVLLRVLRTGEPEIATLPLQAGTPETSDPTERP